MRVFVTGATGFIGSAIVRELTGAGHTVLGLARSARGAQGLIRMGAEAHRGTLEDADGLARAAGACDGVIHMAFIHAITDIPLGARLRIILGGMPGGIVARFMGRVVGTDQRAIAALGNALEGSGRPLIVTVGTLGLAPGRLATEEQAPDPGAVGAPRSIPAEEAVRALAARNVRAMVMRLPPSVHGDGDTGFVPRLIATARKTRMSAYVGDGSNRWPAVHRRDVALLYRLALEKGVAGARYHGIGDEGVATREIAGVIARRLNVPLSGIAAEKAPRHFGWLGNFFGVDNPASSRWTQEMLGWQPREPGLIADIDRPAYFDSSR